MGITLEYDVSLDCLVMIVDGIVTYEALPALAKDLCSHEKFRTNINQLFDCTHGTLSFSLEELQRIAQDFQEIGGLLGLKRKLALVASSDRDYGRMRQYEVFFQGGAEVKVQVFRSLETARQWLAP